MVGGRFLEKDNDVPENSGQQKVAEGGAGRPKRECPRLNYMESPLYPSTPLPQQLWVLWVPRQFLTLRTGKFLRRKHRRSSQAPHQKIISGVGKGGGAWSAKKCFPPTTWLLHMQPSMGEGWCRKGGPARTAIRNLSTCHSMFGPVKKDQRKTLNPK